MDIFRVFAGNLVRLRNERGLTQAQLAERADLSLTTIQGYEAGRQWPEKERVKILAKALRVETSRLFVAADGLSAQPSPKAVLEVVANSLGLELPPGAIERAKAIRAAAEPQPAPELTEVQARILTLLPTLKEPEADAVLSMIDPAFAETVLKKYNGEQADQPDDVKLNRKR
jgi:transcriptional regulator with XRE-family HTH domain